MHAPHQKTRRSRPPWHPPAPAPPRSPAPLREAPYFLSPSTFVAFSAKKRVERLCAQFIRGSEPAKSEDWVKTWTKKNAPLPAERAASRAHVREQGSSVRALPHAVVNPHASCPRPCYRHRRQSRRAVGVPEHRSPLGAKYLHFSGRHTARTICLCWS